MNIGLLGGSFDPPHIGHIFCARIAAEQLRLDRLLVVPTALQPHKPEGAGAPGHIRCEMLQALIGDDPLFELSEIEIERGGVSYTVDTLGTLSELYPPPQHRLYCLIGADAMVGIDKWRDTETIFSLSEVAVMVRTGDDINRSRDRWTERALKVDIPRIEISSTFIRSRVAAGLPIRPIVGAEVDGIIRRYGLYGQR